MDRWLKEIERIKNDEDEMLDRQCIGFNSVSVFFLDTHEIYNLSENYFTNKSSVVDPTWAGAYITPGEITTLRNIHIHAVICHVKSRFLDNYFQYHLIPEEEKELFKELMPDCFKEIQNKNKEK